MTGFFCDFEMRGELLDQSFCDFESCGFELTAGKMHCELSQQHMSKCRLIRMNFMTYVRSVNTSIIGVF